MLNQQAALAANAPRTVFTRRQWLVASSGAIAGAMTAQTVFAAPQTSGRGELTLFIVSDTHVGYRNSESAQKLWQQTAAEIGARKPSLVLHLGDVVDGGQIDKYAAYLECREQIGCPVHEIPGNHDPADGFSQHLRSNIDTVIEHDWLRCVLLNNAHRDSHDGFFTDAQLDWLERELDATRRDDRLALLCCHVPVHTNKHPDRGWYVKPADGQVRFYELMSKSQDQVLAVVHGHFHNGVRGWQDNSQLHEICFPSALYNQNRRLTEQMAAGYNLEEFRPGYTEVSIGQGGIRLQYHVSGTDDVAVKELTKGSSK